MALGGGGGRFREIDWREFASLGFRSPSGTLSTHARQRVCGGVTIWSVWGESTEYRARPAPSDQPYVAFIFKESGSFAIRHRHGPWLPIDAPLVIAPNGLERRIRFEGAWRLLVAKVPRDAMEAFVPHIPAEIGTFHERRVLDQAMHRFLSAATQDTPCSALESHTIAQLAVDMAGAVLLDRLGTGWTRGSPHAALLDHALAVIARQSADIGLTPTRVASEVQSSLRQLQLVFAEVDTTVAAEIRRQRARRARAMLI